MDTIYFLDRIKSEYSITSDYKLAKLMGISTSRLSHYRVGKHSMDEVLALRVEKLLKLKPGTVLLEIQAGRTKCPEAAQVLHDIARKLAGGILALVIAFTALFSPAPSIAANLSQGNTVYYVKSFRRRHRIFMVMENLSFVWVIAGFSKIGMIYPQMTKGQQL